MKNHEFAGYGGVLNHVGGEVWRRKRRALDPAFDKRYLQTLLPKIDRLTRRVVEEMETEAASGGGGGIVDVEWYSRKSTLLLIASIGYNLDLNKQVGNK